MKSIVYHEREECHGERKFLLPSHFFARGFLGGHRRVLSELEVASLSKSPAIRIGPIGGRSTIDCMLMSDRERTLRTNYMFSAKPLKKGETSRNLNINPPFTINICPSLTLGRNIPQTGSVASGLYFAKASPCHAAHDTLLSNIPSKERSNVQVVSSLYLPNMPLSSGRGIGIERRSGGLKGRPCAMRCDLQS